MTEKAATMSTISTQHKNGEARNGWHGFAGFAHDISLFFTVASKFGLFLAGLAAIGFLAIPASRWQLDALAEKMQTQNHEIKRDLEEYGKRLQKVEDQSVTTVVWQARVEEKLDALLSGGAAPAGAATVVRRKATRPKPGSGWSSIFRR
jgi:hypothetical protein